MEKDVRIYTWGILIKGRKERRLSWSEMTPATENRLRAIAQKIRPPVKKRRKPGKRNTGSKKNYYRRQVSAASILRKQSYYAMAELTERANGANDETSA